MKIYSYIPVLLLLLLTSAVHGRQTAKAIPVELSISNPQPRLKENFKVKIDLRLISMRLFESFKGKLVPRQNDYSNSDKYEIEYEVTALKKGKNEIAPIPFTFNNQNYITNPLRYEVIDALPLTDEGVWIRKVDISDSIFCIIIEQRVPASEVSKTEGGRTTISTQPAYEEMMSLNYSCNYDNALRSMTSISHRTEETLTIKGERKRFNYSHSISWFEIIDPTQKFVFTRHCFKDIPEYYEFKDIVITK